MVRKEKCASASDIVSFLKGRTIADAICTTTEGQNGVTRVDIVLDTGDVVSVRTGLYGSGIGFYVPIPPKTIKKFRLVAVSGDAKFGKDFDKEADATRFVADVLAGIMTAETHTITPVEIPVNDAGDADPDAVPF